MKNNILLLIALLLTSAMNVVAQSNDDVFISEPRASRPYHYIHIKGEMNVKLVQDETPGVTVKGSYGQVLNTITWLRNDTLFVYQTNVRKSAGKVQLVINVESISSLIVNGKSNVDCSDLNTDFLTIRAFDGARIKLNVHALKVDSKATGCSFIDLSGTVASQEESTDACGVIDTHLLDVMNFKKNIKACFGGC